MGLFDNLFKKKGIPQKLNIGGEDIDINADAMVYSQIALDAYNVQNYQEAIENFNKAISAQPSNQNFYTMRGTVYEDKIMNLIKEKAKPNKKEISKDEAEKIIKEAHKHDHSHDHDHDHGKDKKVEAKSTKEKKSPSKASKSKPAAKKVSKK